jgi:uncharacterized protein (TIGR02284 family)
MNKQKAKRNNMSELANQKVVEQLEHLLAICNDGIEGYKKASENSKEQDFKTLFQDYVIQRTEYANELKAEIRTLGGDADNKDGGSLGMLHRLWIDIKAKLTTDEDHAALNSCITGEKSALEAYDSALNDNTLPTDLMTLLQEQRAGIQKALIKAEQLVRVYNT